MAAIGLSGDEVGNSEPTKVQLLRDIEVIFMQESHDRIASQTLCDNLALLEERPWSSWKAGKPLNPHQLARLLKPFGAFSRNLKLPSGGVVKGYLFEDLVDTFRRYIPLPP